MEIDDLDAERGGAFVVRADDEIALLPSAESLTWKSVALAASNPHYFATLVWPADVRIAAWKIEQAQQAWIRHQGLPEPEQIKRLVYMVQKYGEGIEYDLRHHLQLSLGELWRKRRWRELLALIDNLPTDSQKNRLLANDEDHLEAVLLAQEKNPELVGGGGPSMADWSLTNSMLATLIDAVNRNTAVTEAVAQTKKKGQKPSFEPYPRPRTAADAVRARLEKKKHEEMNAILLRNRPTKTG